jgi:predicted aspartyl protease
MVKTKAFTLKSAGGPAKAVLFGIELREPESGKALAVTALLDTGADMTCVSTRAADVLALPVAGNAYTQGAGGLLPVKYHYATLALPHEIVFENLLVSDFFGTATFDVLIGMDIINQGDLAFTSDNGNTIVSFRMPHGSPYIDFTKQVASTL